MNEPNPSNSRHLIGVDENQSLWRVLPASRALQLFDSRKNVLVLPAKWDDPFENFLARCAVAMSDGTRASLSALTAAFYGQCWCHREHETDATWRIYAPGDERGVRIKVRAGALFDTIYDSADPFASLSCFLGRIEYKSEVDIRTWLGCASFTQDLMDSSNVEIAKTLLVKRLEFEHEAEVRLLFDARDRPQEHRQIRYFPCDPNSLIEEVVLDPRLTESEAATMEKQLKCFGYQGPVEHSPLYRIPRFPDIAE